MWKMLLMVGDPAPLEVALVVLLGAMERTGRGHLGDDGTAMPARSLLLFLHPFRGGLLLRVW